MYRITNFVVLNQVDYCVWHVVFQMDDQKLEYATDFLYLIKEKKWVFNSLITHELTSLMGGHICIYCGETKIACFVSSKDFEVIKRGIIENPYFLNQVSTELKMNISDISSEYKGVNNKQLWDQLAKENRFYGNLLRIQAKQ